VFALVALVVLFGSTGNVASAVNPADIEAVFGTAVEIRPPSAIVVASNNGLVTLNFNSDSEIKIGSSAGVVADVVEGDRVISTATRNDDGELVALKTIIRVANAPPITKHVVGVVTDSSSDELSIQTSKGDVVNVLIPAGIDAPVVGDGITMVARLDRSSGILTAVGFELTSKTVERIQNARDRAADQAESARLGQIAIDARSKHLSALDDASRALKRVIDAGKVDSSTLARATTQFKEIQRRFDELRGIYEKAARGRNEAKPLLKISGALVDEISSSSFTLVPKGEQDADPFSVDFKFDPATTMVDLPRDLLAEISRTARNPQLLSDVQGLIDPGSELIVRYSIEGDVRTAESVTVRLPRLVEELEAVLEHESLRAFHGVITLVEVDSTLEDALGVVIAANEKQNIRVAAKVTSETEITLDGESSDISSLAVGQDVDILFETPDSGSLSNITGTGVTLRALAIRARSSAPSEEDHISGIVESIEIDVPTITIRPTDGSLIRLFVADDVSVVRNGKRARFGDVVAGDLVVDATRTDSDSDQLTRLVVVARTNVTFAGTITGIGREPARLLVAGDNGRSLHVLVTDDTTVILDGARSVFGDIKTGMTIVNGVYSVTGRGGAFYNVAIIISIESPKVGRAAGTVASVNVGEGSLTVLAGRGGQTRLLELWLPERALGENLTKDGQPIRSLLAIERGDKVDIVLYVIKTGIIEKLSMVSDDFIQTRGTLLGVAENNRFAKVKIANGKIFDLWIDSNSELRLNGRTVRTLRPVADLFNGTKDRDNVSALVTEVTFFRDSLDSDQGLIISIRFQIRIAPIVVEDPIIAPDSPTREFTPEELTVRGVIEAINSNTWVIDGQVFVVIGSTRYIGGDADVGVVAVARLLSRRDGTFYARTITVGTTAPTRR
jgi:hypothetical protein